MDLFSAVAVLCTKNLLIKTILELSFRENSHLGCVETFYLTVCLAQQQFLLDNTNTADLRNFILVLIDYIT